ncbi:unnamed protein product [Calicophoron daubneyi]|uniref:Mitochondrial import receptor subunit TOM70 n=1 Tax=Calicophoron daubneyi TaxID=300641 RepID=A0AAV2TAX5_CALDB
MPISQLTIENVSEKSAVWRPSWKTAALYGIPVLVAGAAGLSYYLYRRRNQRESAGAEDLPKTPLEAAIALKNRGNKYFKAGQYSKAIELYTEGLERCPAESVTERAALYQNRAAAKENLRQYESAVVDCSSALEISPKYLKALNRRAHLHEKLEAWENCLPDVVACCIFEEFKNADNIICMDQVLKKVGQKKAQEEWKNLSHTLPSAAFIRNYLSAFAWNPFEIKASNPLSNGLKESSESGSPNPAEAADTSASDQHPSVPGPFAEAFEALDKALTLLVKEDYEESMSWAERAVKLFGKTLADPSSSAEVNGTAEGDKATGDKTSTDANLLAGGGPVNGNLDEVSDSNKNPQSYESPTSEQKFEEESPKVGPIITDEQIGQAKAAYNKAVLLHATFLALAGRAAEAKQMFQAICAEGSGAETIVRVNALIKSACLSMSVDQDFAACLFDFQTAQSACAECPDVYLHRGQINLLADQLDEALHDLNMAVKLKPEFSIAQAQRLYTLYRRALSESNAERAASRVEEFRRLAQKYPSCLETHSLFAQVLTERGDFSASDEEFAKVIELAPKSGLAYAHRGLLQLRWKQDRDAAFKWFKLGVMADPKCELIHELLGQLAVEQGEFEVALEHFNLAIREAKTQNDLAHLIALREGVKAQYNVCQKYHISISEVVASLKREQQQMMMGIV